VEGAHCRTRAGQADLRQPKTLNLCIKGETVAVTGPAGGSASAIAPPKSPPLAGFADVRVAAHLEGVAGLGRPVRGRQTHEWAGAGPLSEAAQFRPRF
jgi:hypothetical protein